MINKKRNEKSHQVFSFLNFLLWLNNFNLFLFYFLLYHRALHKRSSCTFFSFRRRFKFLFFGFLFHLFFIFQLLFLSLFINTHFLQVTNDFLFLDSNFSKISELEFNFSFKLFKKEETFKVFLLRVDQSILSAKSDYLCLKQGKEIISLVFVGGSGKVLKFIISLLDLFENFGFVFKQLIFLFIKLLLCNSKTATDFFSLLFDFL